MQIELPISKSIANRWLMLQAIHGDELMPVSAAMPEDVLVLHRALTTLKTSETSKTLSTPHINVGNCGTAMRFLTAYCAQCEGLTVILDGVERMHHRPIAQLVDALRSIGAQIEYIGEEGFPPLQITGQVLDKKMIIPLDNPLSTQFVSALLLIGANVQTNSTSPYITLTREIIESYLQRVKRANYSEQNERTTAQRSTVSIANELEKDWSSAAFWYEYVALHGGEITLDGLYRSSLQGDKVVADIFAHLGVQTEYTPEGIILSPIAYSEASNSPLSGRPIAAQAASRSKILIQDFGTCPDLYPAVALTCERLGIELHATGTESLPLKESDRLLAAQHHRTDHDHRMAMALLIAGYEVDDTDCIRKSYPQFINELCKLR